MYNIYPARVGVFVFLFKHCSLLASPMRCTQSVDIQLWNTKTRLDINTLLIFSCGIQNKAGHKHSVDIQLWNTKQGWT